MPRVSTRPTIKLALSPNETATALGVRHDRVAQAVKDGLLPVHRIGAKTKIWVGDIEKWFRSFPAPAKRVYRKRIVPNA